MAGLKALVAGAVLVGALATGSPAGDSNEGSRPQDADGRSAAGAPARGGERRVRRDPARLEKSARRTCDKVAAPSGSERGNGSWDRPYRGVYRLVRRLKAGQTGCLRAGTYRETETIVRRPRVKLRSAPGERATWRGRIVLQGKGDRLLELNLDGSYGPRCRSSGCGALPSPTINAPNVVVADNDIKSPDSGICVHPRSWGRHRPDRFRILRNRIHDCGRRPPTEHDHGVYVADGSGGKIRDNVVFDNADRGIQLYPDARGTVVSHNTVDGNGSGIVYSERSSNNRVSGNVFTNSVVRWNAETYNLTGRGNRFAGNCVRAGNPNPDYNEDGGVDLPRHVRRKANRRVRDEVYAARAAGDFRVLPSSRCAGKGAPASVAAGRVQP